MISADIFTGLNKVPLNPFSTRSVIPLDSIMADITVNIKGPSEIKLSISISPAATVKQLKDEIASQRSDVPAES